MNGLSDALTIGIVITLVFGALFFYLYSRLAQNEKRVSLIENILLDLKMSADAGWGVHGVQRGGDEEQEVVNHVEPVSGPEPLNTEDVDSNDESIYKQVLQQTEAPELASPHQDEIKSFDVSGTGKSSGSPKAAVQVTKVQPNYEAMSNKELKSLVKQRGLSVPSAAGKKEIIAVLRKADGGAPTPAPSGILGSGVEGGSFLGSQEGASLEGEPLGDAETL